MCIFRVSFPGTGLFVYSSGGMMRLLIKGLTCDEHWPHVACGFVCFNSYKCMHTYMYILCIYMISMYKINVYICIHMHKYTYYSNLTVHIIYIYTYA